MPAIVFEQLHRMTTYSGNSSPLYVESLMFGNEPDNSLSAFYMHDGRTACKDADVVYHNYGELEFSEPFTVLTTQRVDRIGVKTFPQLGSMAFFVLLDEERSGIVCPVFSKNRKLPKPTLSVVYNAADNTFTFTAAPPENVKYICYRIIMRNGYDSFEYITYEENITVNAPYIAGTYQCHCVGYTGEGQAVSYDSDYIDVRVDAPGEDPRTEKYITEAFLDEKIKSIPMRLSDLQDVSLVDLLNAQMLRYNSETEKWENVAATAIGGSRVVSITVMATAWIAESENVYYQIVSVPSLTMYSKVDLQPSVEQLATFHARDVNFTTMNMEGVLRVYAIGIKPTDNYTIQATVTEVTV